MLNCNQISGLVVILSQRSLAIAEASVSVHNSPVLCYVPRSSQLCDCKKEHCHVCGASSNCKLHVCNEYTKHTQSIKKGKEITLYTLLV